MRPCTSDAPASNSICTIARVVLPRTIESSTTTTRLPATSASGLNFKRTPSRRSSWSGWMNVRPMYRFLISPSLNGMPSARENPIAAVVHASENERAEAERVAERDQRPFRECDDGVRALEPAHRSGDGFVERRVGVRDQRRDHLAVG